MTPPLRGPRYKHFKRLGLRGAGEQGGWPVRWKRPRRSQRLDLLTGENPVLGPIILKHKEIWFWRCQYV